MVPTLDGISPTTRVHDGSARPAPRGRRRRTAVSAAAAVAATSLALAACGSSASGGGGSAQAKGGGTLLAAGGFAPTTLDPDPKNINDGQSNFMLAGSYMGRLVRYDPAKTTGSSLPTPADLQGELAESFTLRPDQKGYRFVLRQGAKSVAGNPLTADDVAWTFQRMVATKGLGSILLATAGLDLKNPVTVVDQRTVDLNLTAPSAILPATLELGSLGIIDATEAKKHVTGSDPWAYEWLKNHVASFGPYTVTDFTPSTQTTLVPNTNYFRGAPTGVTKVVWKQVPDGAARAQLLTGGGSNFAWELPPAQYVSLKSNDKFDLHLVDAPLVTRLVLRSVGAYADPRVRQAVQLAVDNTAIASAVFPGAGKPGTSCVPDSIPVPGATKGPAAAEVAKAKELLAAAGHADGLDLTIAYTTGGTGELERTAQFLQTQLAAIGVKVQLSAFPTFTAYLDAVTKGGAQAFVDAKGPFVADAGYYMSAFLTSKSPLNYGAYDSPAMDKAVGTAMSSLGDARAAALATACDQVIKDVAQIPLVNLPTVIATPKSVTGVNNLPNLYLHFDDMKVSS